VPHCPQAEGYTMQDKVRSVLILSVSVPEQSKQLGCPKQLGCLGLLHWTLRNKS